MIFRGGGSVKKITLYIFILALFSLSKFNHSEQGDYFRTSCQAHRWEVFRFWHMLIEIFRFLQCWGRAWCPNQRDTSSMWWVQIMLKCELVHPQKTSLHCSLQSTNHLIMPGEETTDGAVRPRGRFMLLNLHLLACRPWGGRGVWDWDVKHESQIDYLYLQVVTDKDWTWALGGIMTLCILWYASIESIVHVKPTI